MPTTFFVLHPGAWSGAAEHLCRPLAGSRSARNPDMPWVSIARGTPYGTVELVRRGSLGRAEMIALISEANAWADGCKRTWQVAATRGIFRKKPSMLRPVVTEGAMGLRPDPMDDLSSEQILSPRAMLNEAGAELEAASLIVAMPKRGWLLAVAGKVGEIPQMQLLQQAAGGVHERAGADALSPLSFFLAAGQIIAIAGPNWISQVKPTPPDEAWQLPAEAAGVRTIHILPTIGMARLTIDLPASPRWQDTGLQPDVLGTRALTGTFHGAFGWQGNVQPGKTVPIVELRLVPDPALATKDRTFAFVSPGDKTPISPSSQPVRLVPNQAIRLPATPGRIEVRIAGIERPWSADAVAGILRVELAIHHGGDDDQPFRARPDHVGLHPGAQDWPPSPPLPGVPEPLVWESFAR